MTKLVFWGLVALTAAFFSTVYAVSGEYMLAILAAGLGVMWLAADMRIASQGTFFFLAFVALAVIASLSDIPVPIILLALSADLAAWDVARFRARLTGQVEPDILTIMEERHLRVLAVTICAGFLVALLPVFVHLSLPFVTVCLLLLLALLALRQSMRSLRAEEE